MSAASPDCPPATLAADAPAPSAIRRDAFYLASQGQPLFAWLHSRQDPPAADHGVILCPPIGYEQLHSHRALRHLADALAGHAAAVLRFDWHGTGDSAGSDEDPVRLATWLANLRDAAQWMRTGLGCQRLSVVGLRMGAMLAARALDEKEFDNFVLWAPVASGKSYVREMQLLDRTAETQPRPGVGKPGDIEAAGLLLSGETAAELSLWNWAQAQPKCRRVLVAARQDAAADQRLLARFESLGIPVEQIVVPGTAEMFIEPHYNQVPREAISQIEAWLSQQIAADASPKEATGLQVGPDEATMWHRPASPRAGAAGQLIRERAVRLCDKPDLFGILSQPTELDESLPTIVLLNSGSVHRVGTGRLYVELARHFAAEGFRCLRMDLCGLGDSVSADSTSENRPYPATTFRDVEIAIEQLRSRFGMRRCVLLGLCSGAYAAFQSAAQLSDAALVESVLVNPLTFHWQDGMSLDSPTTEEILRRHRCVSRALDGKKLLKFVTGRTQIGLLGALRVLAQMLVSRKSVQNGGPARAGESTSAEPYHPRTGDLPGDLARVAAAGRNLAMFFAKTDPGYSILNCEAGRPANRLRKAGQLQLAFFKDADHTFSRRGPRQDLLEALSAHLRRRYQAPA